MHSMRPIGLLTAAPPRGLPACANGRPGSGDRTAPAAAAGAGAAGRPPADDAPAVDEDVPLAVARELEALFEQHLSGSRRLDPVFADDIAEGVVGLTRRGGRRMRPQLLWWSMRACGGGGALVPAALRTAAALELIQTCALVHDDLMDGALTRRGGPALHAAVQSRYAGPTSDEAARQLGASAAVLAGDLALAWADDAMATVALDGGLPAGTLRRLYGVWRMLRTEMAAGQYLDVHGQAVAERSAARAVRSAYLKTALYTVERPLELGAVLADADDATTRALRRAGRCAGLAFQLRDDLDDAFADPEATGKPSGGDLRQGKTTCLLAVTRALAESDGDRRALELLDTAVGDSDLPDAVLERVREIMTVTGARTVVERRIRGLADRARRHLAEAVLAPRPAERLDGLLARITGVPGPGLPQAARPAFAGSRTERRR